MIRDDSPRLGNGTETLEKLLRDFDLRITMLERAYMGDINIDPVSGNVVGTTAVADNASLPPNPQEGDTAYALAQGEVWKADATGTWVNQHVPIP